MKLITRDDIIETYLRVYQRGWGFILSKFNINPKSRTKSTFDVVEILSSNSWDLDLVNERWNKKISGDINKDYKDYFIEKYFSSNKKVRLISIGCGNGNGELELAKKYSFLDIVGIDLSPTIIEEANIKAKEMKYSNIKFISADIYNYQFQDNYYDVVLFQASLHHFENINYFLPKVIIPILKVDGLVIINEYVGADRVELLRDEIIEIKSILTKLPKRFKIRFKTSSVKKSITGPGLLRMLVSDPSEAVDSSSILPVLRSNMVILEEKQFGGNIIVPLLKDIAYNFGNDIESKKALEYSFRQEDEFLKNNMSNYYFGVYKKK